MSALTFPAAARERPSLIATERALADLSRRAADPYAFAEVARRQSEHLPARAANGELPFATHDELAQRLGTEVAEAAFSTRQAGALVPRAVETPRGFYVVKALGREDAHVPAFEDVRETIRTRLGAERRAKAFEAFVQDLYREAGVRFDDQAIAALRVQ